MERQDQFSVQKGCSIKQRLRYDIKKNNVKRKPNQQKYVLLQTCVPRDQYAKPEAFDTQALGRNLQLGSFYDARQGLTQNIAQGNCFNPRTNMFFPESSFWTREKINDNANQKNGGSTKVKYLSYQRTLDKTDHIDIHAELEMDFMSKLRYKIYI